jgi:hypothetical protein
MLRTIRSCGRCRLLAVMVGLALAAGILPASADVGLPGGSYQGATEPTGSKPQSKLWYHDNLWWGVLFSPASGKFEIYKYTPNQWSWSTTGVVVEDRKTAKVDALLDGTSLYIGASVPGALPDGTKALYLHRFHYDGANDRFVRETANGKISLGNTAVEEIVMAKDTMGNLWANWTNGGTVYVTHSNGGSHTSWITPYALVPDLVSGTSGDSASIVAFGGKIGVMWSNTVPLGASNGFHFAVHVDGDGDVVSADPLLSDWAFETALMGVDEADDHMNLKSLNGEVFAAVKHDHALGTQAQISVLRRTAAGVWSSHVVWLNSSNTTRPILEIDTSSSRAYVFASGLYSGTIYRKDASLSDLVFPPGDGSQFIALSTSSNDGLDNATSTKQNVNSSSGLLVMAGDDGTDTYAFNYLTLGGPMVPAPPTGVTALPGLGSVSLTWSAPGSDGGSAVTGYAVVPYLNGVPQAPQLSTGTTKLVTGLLAGTTYTFKVQAQNVAGLGPASSASSPVATFGPPGAPTAVAATAGNSAANVTWSPPAGNGGSPVTGYTVTASPGGMTASVGGTATSADVAGLTNGVSYTFTVKATNLVGTGPASAPSAPIAPRAVPGAPTGVSAAPDDGSATVSWSTPADAGGSPITGYVVSWAVNGVNQSTSTVMSTATTRTITGLTNGTTYTFKVAAINAVGTGLASAPSAPVTPASPLIVTATVPNRVGYRMLGAGGLVYAFGDARDHGEPDAQLGTSAAVDIESNPADDGYWVVDETGRVFAYQVPHFGNVDPTKLRAGEKVTSLSATPGADGYWIFTTAGRVLPFGKAKPYGDLLNLELNGPVLDSIATPSGNGYYMVASDGGVFTFGDARFLGSMGAVPLNAPVQSLVPDPDGTGYWLVASDGGTFAFQAPFRGSMGAVHLNRPVTGMVPYGNGYLMVGEDGGIFNFSDRPFQGSLGANPPSRPIVSVAALV